MSGLVEAPETPTPTTPMPGHVVTEYNSASLRFLDSNARLILKKNDQHDGRSMQNILSRSFIFVDSLCI